MASSATPTTGTGTATATTTATTIIEECRIAPLPQAQPKLSLPLTFFDIEWVPFHPIQRLSFYDFPSSKDHFIHHIIPSIKASLSAALKHFLPLAGNLVYPPDHAPPEIHYRTGDTISLVFTESSHDFNHLTANYPRKTNEFHHLLAEMIPSGEESRPLFAVKVTLFPDTGICMGYTNHHAVGDASAIISFIKAWALIHKLGGDDNLNNLLPVYDRSLVNYPRELDDTYWNVIKNLKPRPNTNAAMADKVRATYTFDREQIQKLKGFVVEKRPSLRHVSTFTVICAFAWRSLVRTRVSVGEGAGGDNIEYFLTAVECRGRLDPPAPTNYFGNCVAPCYFGLRHEEVIGDEGFLVAVEAIGEAIQRFVNKQGGILAGAGKWLPDMGEMMVGKPVFGVAGSPKFDLYDVDFGWGRPKKCEAISIDHDNGSVSLSKSRECEGGFEIGVSLPRAKMDAFAAVFQDSLKYLLS